MAKYNYHVKKEKAATYRAQVKPEVIDEIYEQILSAAVSLRFQMNYAELVAGYRIRDAVSMLQDKRNRDLTMGEIASACGFANRQSFYAAFYHLQGKTPKQYQSEFLAKMTLPKRTRKPKTTD